MAKKLKSCIYCNSPVVGKPDDTPGPQDRKAWIKGRVCKFHLEQEQNSNAALAAACRKPETRTKLGQELIAGLKEAVVHSEQEERAHGLSRKGKTCKACFGHGKAYCCGSLEYVLTVTEIDIDASVYPYFPGTTMELNYCPFCGRRLDRL